MFATRRLSAACLLPVLSACLLASANAQTAYPQPDPSADEQFMLERINIARSNPYIEGAMLATLTDATILQYYSYYHVNPATLIAQFSTYAAQPPLAMNAKLMASSRVESVDMATHGFQDHTGSDGTTFSQRITNQGYNWAGAGENIYAYSENAFFGHVGFNADWGVPSLDHRANIMNDEANYPLFREVGISCVPTSKAGFGPMVITQDFAKPADGGVAYVLGVVYADANHNASYDQGEGLAGVTISTDSGAFYAVTATAGGFVLPLPPTGAGTLTLVASGGPLGGPRTKTVAWTAGTNVKVDFTTADPVTPAGAVVPPPAPAPVPAGPTTVTLSVPSNNARGSTGLTGLFTVSRTGGDNRNDLSVRLTYSGTAVSNWDYAPLPARVVIPAGANSVDVPVTAMGGTTARKAVNILVVHQALYTVPVGQGWGHVYILADGKP